MSKQRNTAAKLVSQRTYARLRGVSSTWISKLAREGRIPTTAGRIDVARADAMLADEAALSKDGEVTLAEAERRWRLAIARLKELELERKRGDVCDVAYVEKCQTKINVNIRNRLLGMPAKLAPRLTGVMNPAKIKSILELEVRQTLEELVKLAVPD